MFKKFVVIVGLITLVGCASTGGYNNVEGGPTVVVNNQQRYYVAVFAAKNGNEPVPLGFVDAVNYGRFIVKSDRNGGKFVFIIRDYKNRSWISKSINVKKNDNIIIIVKGDLNKTKVSKQ